MTTPDTTTMTEAESEPMSENTTRAIWLMVAALIGRGLPVLHAMHLSKERPYAYLETTQAEHVTTWGRVLDAPPVQVFSALSPDDPTKRFTSTSVEVAVEGGVHLYIGHFLVENLGAAAADDAGEVSA